MKKTSIAILFTVLITATCVFASCNAYDMVHPNNQDDTDYESTINDLEDRILQLQRDQFISDTARDEQISKLEEMISQLKSQNVQSPSPSPNEDESGNQDTSDESDSESETGSDESAENEIKAEFLYTVADGVATITGYTGKGTEIIIPSQIDGYNVISIADDAFSSDTLNSVVIPNGVLSIGWFAFRECDALYSVTIPDSVNNIGYNAFPRNQAMSIICSGDSFAARYASSYGISVTPI